jgi:hypothetical protein
MKDSKVLKIYLILAGLLLAFIGSATLFIPVDIKSNSGIDIAGQISVINDTRASGALYLGIALLLLSGALKKNLRYTSSILAPLLFITLGLGRLLSIVLDGMPVDGLFKATILEFVLGSIGLILFIKNKH